MDLTRPFFLPCLCMGESPRSELEELNDRPLMSVRQPPPPAHATSSDHVDLHLLLQSVADHTRPDVEPVARETSSTLRIASQVETPLIPPAGGDIALTYLAGATFLIRTAVGNILAEPTWPVHWYRSWWPALIRDKPPRVNLDTLPPVSIVLIGHQHRKYFDIPTLNALSKRDDPIFVTGFRSGRILRSHHIANVMALDWWQTFNAGGICITMTPAPRHADRRLFDCRRVSWGGFLVETLETRLFFMAVTGYSPVLRNIRPSFGRIDVALLPIRSEKRKTFMSVDHLTTVRAIKAHRDLAPRYSIAVPALGAVRDDEEHEVRAELAAALVNDGIPADRFIVLCPGESIVVELDRSGFSRR
jgi:L-ascorbate metabolism protein UlaG (beta-lactamase superfamily)